METKRNLNYFTSKGMPVMAIIGLVLGLIGVVCIIIEVPFLISAAIALVGFVLFFIFNGGKSSGDDIEYQVGEKIKDMRERGMIRFELFEKSLKYKEPFTVQGYEFNDEVYYKKGSDGRNRTSVYSAAILFFTGEKMHIHRRRFSFIEEMDEELGGSFRYIDLDHAEVRDFYFQREVGKRTVKFHDYHFVVVGKDGSDILDMSVDYGADIDKACDDINRIIEIRTKAHYEKVARVEADRKARLEAAAAEAAAQNNQ